MYLLSQRHNTVKRFEVLPLKYVARDSVVTGRNPVELADIGHIERSRARLIRNCQRIAQFAETYVHHDRTRRARRNFPPEPIELRDDEAIRKARRVDSLHKSAVTAVARAHDGQMRGWCQARQVFRRDHRIILCK